MGFNRRAYIGREIVVVVEASRFAGKRPDVVLHRIIAAVSLGTIVAEKRVALGLETM